MRHLRSAVLFAALAIIPFSLAEARTPAQRAPVSELVRAVDIPFEQFTLPNGLRVVVHTDRKAPIVAVSVWYGVGSADEPKGKTGFAHLFEHLMFNGSANYDGEFFVPLEEVGATDYNGTTSQDRTNYFQNVPTPALDLALFLEADRMGNLLPAVTQAKLDNQRSVVQNEKRQGDNQPFGLVRYALFSGLFPEGHPYHHQTIGSMADLDAASLEDVRNWFAQHYGPNNAVLVLAGDVDVPTARALVEKHFGAIPRGPATPEPVAAAPVRTETTRAVLNDRVANARKYIAWAAPGGSTRESALLDVALSILASGESSRLHNALVRDERLALAVGGSANSLELATIASIVVDLAPGADPAVVERRVDEIVAEFLKEGPTRDEVLRVATRAVSGTIGGLEEIGGFGGKATTLASGLLYENDPGHFKRELGWYAAATPASVQAAARAALTTGSHRLLVQPGQRGAAELALAGVAGQRVVAAEAAVNATPDRSKLPPVRGEATLEFPKVERAALANGVKVIFARRSAVPVVTVRALFDAGSAGDDPAKLGLQALTLDTMTEGAGPRTGRELSEELERLGGQISAGFSSDSTNITMTALTPNLRPTLALFADVVLRPTFPESEIERLRAIQLARIAQEEASPGGIAARTLRPLMFGASHPYGQVSSLGTAASVKSIARRDLLAFHERWIRPDNMTLLVVGDTTLGAILPRLEAAFGTWRAPASTARGVKAFSAPAPEGVGRIVLMDRPNSPQSVISAGAPLSLRGADDPLALRIANETLGGSFTSRLNSDLREAKGWSYGVRSGVSQSVETLAFTISAPVQADRTADSILALRENILKFRADRPVTEEELSRALASNTLSLPGDFETAGAVLGALQTNFVLGRSDDYQSTLAARFRALTRDDVTGAAKTFIDPDKLVWVVVGDAAVVEPQLRKLGMPIEVRKTSSQAP